MSTLCQILELVSSVTSDGCLDSEVRGTTAMASAAASNKAADITQNAHGHQTLSARRLEKVAPRTKPPGARALANYQHCPIRFVLATYPNNENARFCFIPGSYDLEMIAMAFGSINAGPIPCIPRQNAKKTMLLYTAKPDRKSVV